MLVKAELKEVPICECPTFSKKELPAKDALAAASSVCDLPRSGKILVVDYYTAKDRKLQGRFFSDGQKYITYLPVEDRWDTAAPEKHFKYVESVSSKETLKEISRFLDTKFYGDKPWYYSQSRCKSYNGTLAVCAEFASHKRYEINRKRSDARYERMRRHLDMFPERYPKEVDTFLEQRAFPTTYVFYSKLDKHRKRTGYCASCGKTFRVPEDVKHNSPTACPRCGKSATYCAEWLGMEKTDKAVLCYPLKKDGQLLLEFSNVTRKVFRGAKKPSYDIEAFACCLYLYENGKPKIYSYGMGSAYYYLSHEWCSWGHTPVYRDAYVYTGNLREIFGDKYYNVDIPALMEQVTCPIDFTGLLDNLKHFPQTEYLCKCGMTLFASKLRQNHFLDPTARNIHDALGIRKQDVPLYVKHNVTVSEHEVLWASKYPLDDTTILLFRDLYGQLQMPNTVSDLISRMSMQKLYNYVDKQKTLGVGDASRVLTWMRDYYAMCEELDVSLNRKNMFPADIKKSHDELSDRIAKLRAELIEQASKDALELVNNYFDGYGRNGYVTEIHVSCTFTWDKSLCEGLAYQWEGRTNKPVKLGGVAYGSPAEDFVQGMYIRDNAVFTSRGCNNNCPWCIVPKTEGRLKELPILTVRKKTTEGYYSRDVEVTYDKLFLFAYSEVFSGTDDVYRQEGETYPIFTDTQSRVKTLGEEQDASACAWWLRSPYYSYRGSFWYVNEGGWGSNKDADIGRGVVFGFCV